MREQLYWHGVPVPYVALWSSETGQRVAPDRYADDQDALFLGGNRGDGEPVWGKMHEARQRETVWLRRCQVCNCRLKTERSFGMDVPDKVFVGERWRPMLIEPPACARCTKYALEHCPGNRRRIDAGHLRCYEVLEYAVIGQIIGAHKDGSAELNALLAGGRTAIGYLKCALIDFRELSVEQLSVEVAV